MDEKYYTDYNLLFKSGMFFEIFPAMTGDWDRDMVEWVNYIKSTEMVPNESFITGTTLPQTYNPCREIVINSFIPNLPFDFGDMVSYNTLSKDCSLNEEKIVVSTLDGAEKLIVSGRQEGNTTRLIDYAIDIIFSGHICKVQDHHENGQHIRANQNLFDRIVKRLEHEHHHGSEKFFDTYKCDRNKLTIEKI